MRNLSALACVARTAACDRRLRRHEWRLVSRSIYVLCLLTALLAALPAKAVDYCVSNAVEFQAALNSAALNSSGFDNIVLVGGAYSTADNGDAPFTYNSVTAHSVNIVGGFAPACAGYGAPSLLSGDGLSAVFESHSTQGGVGLSRLIIENGLVVAPEDNNGVGLRMNTAIAENGEISVEDCIIRTNNNQNLSSSYGGFYLVAGSSLHFDNNLVYGNYAAAGAGAAGFIFVESGASAYVANNTISANTSGDTSQGAGMIVSAIDVDSAFLFNNIFWGNTRYGLMLPTSGTVALQFNDYGTLQGTPSSDINVGNVSLAPQFVNRSNGDFHLSASSPLFGLGVGGGLLNGLIDLDGHTLSSHRVDLGAYQDTIFLAGFETTY